jgi:hypothetical protein
MKLGLGFYRQMLTQRNYNFAKQLGVTHIIAHLVDYFIYITVTLAVTFHGLNWPVTFARLIVQFNT